MYCHRINLLYTGTHDVQQIVVTSTLGGVNISGDFVERSTATGILAVVYTLTESDIYYLFVPHFFGRQKASAIFECIPSGTYNISLFSVEESGLPFNRAATNVRTLSIDQGRNVDCPSKSKYIPIWVATYQFIALSPNLVPNFQYSKTFLLGACTTDGYFFSFVTPN